MTTHSGLLRAVGLVVAAGGLDHETFAVRIEGEPIAKARVRVKRDRHYAPGRTLDAELDIAARFQLAAPAPFSGNAAVAAVFYRSNKHRVDVDNLLKTLLDGITKSGAVWADDDQVTALLGVVEYDPDWPRIDVAIAHHTSTMLRGDERLTHSCETCGTAYRPHSDKQGPSRYCSQACRPRRLLTCPDCGGPKSQPYVKRCSDCYRRSQNVVSAVDLSPQATAGTAQQVSQ